MYKRQGQSRSTAGSSASRDDAAGSALGDAAAEQARELADGFVQTLMEMWLGGGCVRLDVALPDTVEPNTSVPGRVAVRSTTDGGEAPSHVTISATGIGEVAPTSLTSTGDFTFTAGDAGEVAQLAFEATSRRGRAVDLVSVSTGRIHLFLLDVSFNELSGFGWFCFADDGREWGVTGSIAGPPGGSGDIFGFADGQGGFGVFQGDEVVSATGGYYVGKDEDGLPVALDGAWTGFRSPLVGGDPTDISGNFVGTLTIPDAATLAQYDAQCAAGRLAPPPEGSAGFGQ